MSKMIRFTLISLSLLTLGLLLVIAHSLASLGAAFFPGYIAHFFVGLVAVEAVCVFFLWHSVFGGNDHLQFPQEPSKEQRDAFTDELTARLQKNSLVAEAGFTAADPDFLEKSLAFLSKKADLETRRAAEKIFLATALSQNGKIDSLIVFITLTRLVWRISRLYNQRPHPNEIVSLYWAVASSAFLALSFEELDISTEITVGFGEIFHAVAPAAMTSSVPFVGAAVQKFTSCSIDGAANAYLALRTGIITRNAYRYGIEAQSRPSRATVYREAGSILLGMASGLVEQVAKSVGCLVWEVTRKTPGKTVHLLKNGASSVGGGIANSTGRVVESTSAFMRNTGEGIKKAGSTVGDVTQTATSAVSHAVTGTAGKTVKGVTEAADFVGRGVGRVSGAVAGVTQTVGDATVAVARGIGDVSEKGLYTVQNGLGRAKWTVVQSSSASYHMAGRGLQAGKDALYTGAAATRRAANGAASATFCVANAVVENVAASTARVKNTVNASAANMEQALLHLRDGAEQAGKKTTRLLKNPFHRRKEQ